MWPRNAYKDMLDNVVSLITCVSMIHQNQLEQMAIGAMFATFLQVSLHLLQPSFSGFKHLYKLVKYKNLSIHQTMQTEN
jgi:hypothetical protein